MKTRWILAALSVVALGVAAVFLFQTGKFTDSTEAAASPRSSAIGVAPTKAGQTPEPISSKVTSAPVSPELARAAAMPSLIETSTSAALRWRAASRSEDLTQTILALLVSQNPNDWIKASVLNNLCAAAIPTNAEVGAQLKTDLPASYQQLLVEARQRCGDAARSIEPLVQPGVGLKARDADASLARVLLTASVLREGLTPGDTRSIRSVMSDPDLAGAWLARNRSGLIQALGKSDALADASQAEKLSVYFLSLCQSGEDCGPKSLHALSLCVLSTFERCAGGTVQDNVLSVLPQDRQAKIIGYADMFLASLRGGNLALLGIPSKT
jgi:hypothetical protein